MAVGRERFPLSTDLPPSFWRALQEGQPLLLAELSEEEMTLAEGAGPVAAAAAAGGAGWWGGEPPLQDDGQVEVRCRALGGVLGTEGGVQTLALLASAFEGRGPLPGACLFTLSTAARPLTGLSHPKPRNTSSPAP